MAKMVQIPYARRVTLEEMRKKETFQVNYFLLTDEEFKGISLSAKILYSILKDKMIQAFNQAINLDLEMEKPFYVDENGDLYIQSDVQQIGNYLNLSLEETLIILRELEENKLVQIKHTQSEGIITLWLLEIE